MSANCSSSTFASGSGKVIPTVGFSGGPSAGGGFGVVPQATRANESASAASLMEPPGRQTATVRRRSQPPRRFGARPRLSREAAGVQLALGAGEGHVGEGDEGTARIDHIGVLVSLGHAVVAAGREVEAVELVVGGAF